MTTAADIIHHAYIDWVRSKGVLVSDGDFGRFAVRRLIESGYDVHRRPERPQPLPTAEPRQRP